MYSIGKFFRNIFHLLFKIVLEFIWKVDVEDSFAFTYEIAIWIHKQIKAYLISAIVSGNIWIEQNFSCDFNGWKMVPNF